MPNKPSVDIVSHKATREDLRIGVTGIRTAEKAFLSDLTGRRTVEKAFSGDLTGRRTVEKAFLGDLTIRLTNLIAFGGESSIAVLPNLKNEKDVFESPLPWFIWTLGIP